MWTYETYRPQGDVTEVIRSCDRYGCSTTKNKVLMFPNGTVVRDPADLELLVAPDSHVMDSARTAHRADERARSWGYGLIASIAVGMAIAMDGNSRENYTELDVGLGIAVGGLLSVRSAATTHARRRARRARGRSRGTRMTSPNKLQRAPGTARRSCRAKRSRRAHHRRSPSIRILDQLRPR